MKKIIYILLIGFVFLGCTKKLQTDIPAYVTLHQNDKQNISVSFKQIKDQRATNIVSTAHNKDKTIAKYPLSNNVKIWYEEAFIRELKNVNMYNKNSPIKIYININKLEASYKEFTLENKENLEAKVSLELIIKRGNETITSNININQSSFKSMMLDASGFEEILTEAMNDSVSKTIGVLILKLQK